MFQRFGVCARVASASSVARILVSVKSITANQKNNYYSSITAHTTPTCAIRSFGFQNINHKHRSHSSYCLIQYNKSETEFLINEMNSKHLSAGSPYPPLKDGKLRFYNMRFCPYAQRSLLVAYAKGVPLDIVNVDLKDKPEWLFEKNPGAKVPTIETAQGSLYESLLVSDYLDEVYPKGPLYPKDPFKKTLDKIWMENISKVTGPFYRIFFAKGDAEKIKEGLKELLEGLELFDKELKKRGTLFFAGNEAPGMLDYMFWPWMERIPVLKLALPDALDYEAQKVKNAALEKWRQAMKNDPAVQAVYISPENHHLFMKSFAHNPKPNYDLLAE